ncbi:hypothetical protein GWK47_002509 [Chionoecetes opilio]|uniref:Uncharacterized protein n=1 Tax=Chionoecetes opilio TaxID=41210 RepID=A0A8J4XWJ4_CHIOP|nr:hypothetical protein GWK47_002509 [Chionoecetes opilio]
MSFDTTASNTGIHTGCCRLLEEALGKPLLNLACRHHVIELILAAAFKEVMGPSSGPTIQLFKRFREQWPYIPHEDPEAIDNVVDPRIDLVPSWKEHRSVRGERDPVEESPRGLPRAVHLSLFYLTGNLRQPIKSREPSPRPLDGKGNLRSQDPHVSSHVQMTTREGKGLEEIALFVVLLYSRAWMRRAGDRSCVKRLNLVKDLHHFQEINGAIGKTTLTTFSRHLWYLGAHLVGLSFSRRGSAWRRRRRLLKRRGKRKGPRPNPVSTRLRISSSTPRSPHSPPAPLFARSPSSTSTSPSFPSLWTKWETNPAYQKGVSTVKNLASQTTGRAWGGDLFHRTTTP